MSPPVWLKEEIWIQDFLHWFLDRVDQPREKAITRRISKSSAPPLFQFGSNTEYYWGLFESLEKDFQIFEIKYDKKQARHQEHYENAQLRFNPECEATLRTWLSRPQQNPKTLLWEEALEPTTEIFIDKGESLLNSQPTLEGCTPAEMVESFISVKSHLGNKLTLRELSALCFKGDSKFLDNKQDLLVKLFGDKVSSIMPRPLLLTAWAPPGFEKLLIIENQDTFLRLVENPPENYALLYSGGFRASAERLNSEHTRFAFLPGSDTSKFEGLWLSPTLPVFFWGDLDYSGIAIFKALKQVIPNLEAWKPGYQPMLEILTKNGHTPEQSGKTRQTHPGPTYNEYVDTALLASIETLGLFLDQESITPILRASRITD